MVYNAIPSLLKGWEKESSTMKNALLLLSLLSLAPLAHAQEDEPEVCTAVIVDGDDWQMARVKCDSPYAGKCIKDTVRPDGTHAWVDVKCEDVLK